MIIIITQVDVRTGRSPSSSTFVARRRQSFFPNTPAVLRLGTRQRHVYGVAGNEVAPLIRIEPYWAFWSCQRRAAIYGPR